MATGGSRPSLQSVDSVTRHYPTTTAKIKGRREEIVIVGERGASVDGNGRQSIITGRATDRRYGRGSYPIATVEGKRKKERPICLARTSVSRRLGHPPTIKSSLTCRGLIYRGRRPLAACEWLTSLRGASVNGCCGIDNVIASPAANLAACRSINYRLMYWIILHIIGIG